MSNRKISVLIVEDDDDIRNSLKEIIALKNYQTSEAINGEEALALLKSQQDRPHLILLDLMMPIMNGTEFMTQKSMDPEIAKIPVIVLTADGDPAKKVIGSEVVGVLRKPIELQELYAMLELHCG